MEPVGAFEIVTTELVDAGAEHVPCLIVAVYVPSCVTFNVAPVCPFIVLPFLNQMYEVPPVAVSVNVPPWHMEPVVGEIDPDGADVVVITAVFNAGPLQVPCLMITKYVPSSVTFNVALVSPAISSPFLNHVYDVPPVAVKVSEPPVQILPVEGEIVPTGSGAIETIDVLEAGPLQSPW